jgi:phage gp29-like protein
MPNPFRDLWDALPWRRARSIAGNTAIFRSSIPAGAMSFSDTDATPTDQSAEVKPPLTTGQEFGASGTQVYGGYIRQEDHNPELDDFVKATRIYDKMRKGDAQINAMLSVLKLPLRGATWTCVPPADGDEVDQQIADYVNSCIFEDDAMELGWDYTLRHILLQLDHGFSVFEVVWEVDESGAFRVKRLAPRLPRTIRRWHVDRNGRLRAIQQYAPVPVPTERDVTQAALYRSRVDNSAAARYEYNTHTKFQWLTIPADYLAVFTLNREGDNYEGISILRTIYRNWYYKDQAYNLEGVRLDRFGVGIPVAKLDDTHTLTQSDLDNLTEVLKSVRSNERAFLIAPPGVEYKLLPETGSKTAGTGATNWINHHDQQIARNVLAGFLTLGNDPHGTLGFGSRLTDMFISSLNGIAAGICSDLKTQVVKKLCDLNFDMTKRKYPRVTCRDLEQVDMSNLVQALAVLANTWVQPDDDIEKMLRKVLQLPPLKPEQKRANQKQAQVGTTAAAEAAPVGQDGTPVGAPTPAEAANGNTGLPKQKPPTDAPKEVTAPTALNDRLQTLSILRSLSAQRQQPQQPVLPLHSPQDEE